MKNYQRSCSSGSDNIWHAVISVMAMIKKGNIKKELREICQENRSCEVLPETNNEVSSVVDLERDGMKGYLVTSSGYDISCRSAIKQAEANLIKAINEIKTEGAKKNG